MPRPHFVFTLASLLVLQAGAATEPAGIAGVWDSVWGIVTIETAPIKGKNILLVTGSYVASKDTKGTIKSGTFDPATDVLEFAFEEPWRGPAKGTAYLTLADGGKRFIGTYEQGDECGEWNMTRLWGDSFAARVDSVVANSGIRADTPGAAVLVIEGGMVVFEKGYGLANLKDKKAVTPQTTFELASCSKQFAGAAILRLFEQGKLVLEDDVRKYLPELPEYDRENPIRILHLARHTSGLPEYLDFQDVKGKSSEFLSDQDYAGEFTRQREKFPLLFPTGRKFKYIDSNYMLMGLIVERISGKSFGTFLKTEFFDPLGMKTATAYETPQIMPSEPAIGYRKDKDAYQELWGPPPFRHEKVLTVGDGGVWVSLADMTRWDQAWREGRVLRPETLKLALVPSKTGDGKANQYAFGWIVRVEKLKLLGMSHNGAWGGFHTTVGRNLAEDRTIIVLSNLDSVDPKGISSSIERLCRAMSTRGK